MTPKKQMPALIRKLLPHQGHENLRLGIAPFQDAREVREAYGFDAVQHLDLQVLADLAEFVVFGPCAYWGLFVMAVSRGEGGEEGVEGE